jgi:putative membrane protein
VHLAEQKASSPEVKQFALEMDKDQARANARLMQIAESRGLAVRTESDGAHKQAAQQLSMLSGAQFDQQYMQAQVADHKTAVALFQQEANSGQDPLLKRYAQTYLPMLQHHLQMAESIKLSG